MAGISIGTKLLSMLSNLFKSIASPIPGYRVDDVKVKQNRDNFSSLFKFEGDNTTIKDESGEELKDISGNKIELNVLLNTINSQTVLNPLLQGINKIGDDDFAEKGALLDILLGTADERPDNEHPGEGHGLLGYKFTAVTQSNDPFKWQTAKFQDMQWSWGDICKRIKFSLECESPGKDYGAIESKQLVDCGKLIGEYLVKVGLIKTTNEIKINVNTLIIPILSAMQKMLTDYFNDAVKKYAPNGVKLDQQLDEDDIADQIDEAFGDNDIPASKHIDVTLQKITGSTAFNMTAIRANYDPSLVLMDMDEIIGQPEFIDSLTETPTTYSIDVDDDGFDIEPCEKSIECNPCESLCEVFKSGIRAYRNLYIIHWMSNGNDMMKLHLMAEEMYEELVQEIDTIGELLVEKQGTVPQLDFPCDYIPVQNYDFQTGLDYIKNLIQMYIDCIDFAYCNQDSDVQSVFDEWLRYWKKQMNYFVERQEI